MAREHSWLTGRDGGWCLTALLTVAIGLTLAAGAARRHAQGAETWQALVEAGDELVAGRPATATLGGQPLTARKAYLLAFHRAQDAGDLEHVLAVADRLDAAGEPELAAHVRRATEALLKELER
jgi:hypothetical protein